MSHDPRLQGAYSSLEETNIYANNFNMVHSHNSIIEVKTKLYGDMEEGRVEFY